MQLVVVEEGSEDWAADLEAVEVMEVMAAAMAVEAVEVMAK